MWGVVVQVGRFTALVKLRNNRKVRMLIGSLRRAGEKTVVSEIVESMTATAVPATAESEGSKHHDAQCVACDFQMADGRYVGRCPKCGSDQWFQTTLRTT